MRGERKEKNVSLCCYWFLNDGESSRENRDGKLLKKKGKKVLKREKWGKIHSTEREGKRGNNRKWSDWGKHTDKKLFRQKARKKIIFRKKQKIFLCSKCSKFKQKSFLFIFSCLSSVISDKIRSKKIK